MPHHFQIYLGCAGTLHSQWSGSVSYKSIFFSRMPLIGRNESDEFCLIARYLSSLFIITNTAALRDQKNNTLYSWCIGSLDLSIKWNRSPNIFLWIDFFGILSTLYMYVSSSGPIVSSTFCTADNLSALSSILCRVSLNWTSAPILSSYSVGSSSLVDSMLLSPSW